MNTLQSLRSLVLPPQEGSLTGSVVAVSDNGAVSVLTGSKVITCFSNLPVAMHDRVRIQGRAVLAIIAPPPHEPAVYRV